ncbi:histidine phosphatase superfamily [Daldinia vernicosa]|uniref:histidine phosphatase superfamily n=1 Tax=Daldinia vernicosa TaxID=114800 RepID=UPI002008CF2E|nr:histidine phosphatase superfamily [Daldinia vernicosa]KAI0850116.1 histidine phosphatase superfamily [Daldinia vernicosa]
MAPTIDIIRHAEATHNIAGSRKRDAKLTNYGAGQCILLRDAYPFGPKVTHIVSSPLRRAIDTGVIGITPIVDEIIKIKLLADLQEISPSPSSTGLPKSSLSRRYDEKGLVEVDELDEKWHLKSHNSPYAPQVPKVEARARSARQHLRTLARQAIEAGKDDAHIVVITHGEFAHWLTDDFQGVTEASNSGWRSTEFRSYQIQNILAPDHVDPVLIETTESIVRRQAFISNQQTDGAPVRDPKEIAIKRVDAYTELYENQGRISPYSSSEDEDSDGWVDVGDELE